MMGWNNWNNMMGGCGMLGGGLISLLILGAFIVGVVLLVRNSSSSRNPRTEPASQTQNGLHQTPTEILKTRYAKGEIDREEYEARRKDLERDP